MLPGTRVQGLIILVHYMSVKNTVNITAIGDTDHGKTTLAAAITSCSAAHGYAKSIPYDEIDAAPEERFGELKINAYHVPYRTCKRAYVHVDFPTHADYVTCLTAGAVKMDGAILVVSATDGPMPQTRESISLARQVGVPYIIVYLNKCDMIDDGDMLIMVEDEIRDLLTLFGYPGYATPIIRGSSLRALNGEDDGWGYGVSSIKILLDALDSCIPDPI